MKGPGGMISFELKGGLAASLPVAPRASAASNRWRSSRRSYAREPRRKRGARSGRRRADPSPVGLEDASGRSRGRVRRRGLSLARLAEARHPPLCVFAPARHFSDQERRPMAHANVALLSFVSGVALVLVAPAPTAARRRPRWRWRRCSRHVGTCGACDTFSLGDTTQHPIATVIRDDGQRRPRERDLQRRPGLVATRSTSTSRTERGAHDLGPTPRAAGRRKRSRIRSRSTTTCRTG